MRFHLLENFRQRLDEHLTKKDLATSNNCMDQMTLNTHPNSRIQRYFMQGKPSKSRYGAETKLWSDQWQDIQNQGWLQSSRHLAQMNSSIHSRLNLSPDPPTLQDTGILNGQCCNLALFPLCHFFPFEIVVLLVSVWLLKGFGLCRVSATASWCQWLYLTCRQLHASQGSLVSLPSSLP